MSTMKNAAKARLTQHWWWLRNKATRSASHYRYDKDVRLWYGPTRDWLMDDKATGRSQNMWRQFADRDQLVNAGTRKTQIAIARIRLQNTPDNTTLQWATGDCLCDACGEKRDGARHRLFECKKYDAWRLKLAPNLKEAIEGGTTCLQGIQDAELIKRFFTWEMLIVQSHLPLTKLPAICELMKWGTNIETQTQKKLAEVLSTFLKTTELDKFFCRSTMDAKMATQTRAAREVYGEDDRGRLCSSRRGNET